MYVDTSGLPLVLILMSRWEFVGVVIIGIVLVIAFVISGIWRLGE